MTIFFAPLDMESTHQRLTDLDFTQMASPTFPALTVLGLSIQCFPMPVKKGQARISTHQSRTLPNHAIAHLRQGTGDDACSVPSYGQMWTKVSDTPFPPPDTGYGMGWMIGEYGGHRVVGHAGIDPVQRLHEPAARRRYGPDHLANQSDAENLTSLPAFFMR